MAARAGNSPAALRARYSSTDPTPAVAEQPLPAGPARPPPRRRPGARRPGCCRSATVPTCGRPASTDQRHRRRSRDMHAEARRGRWVRARASTTVRTAPDLPARGPPTTAGWPAALARSSVSRSRRCRYGRSITPTGTCSVPPDTRCREAPSRRTAGMPSSWSRGGDRIQRRQPDPVCRRPSPDHRRDHRVEHRAATVRLARSGVATPGARPAPPARTRKRRGPGAGACEPGRGHRTDRCRLIGPDTYAARNRTSSPCPMARKAEPGAGGNRWASGTPRTARDSAAEKVRSAIR